MAEHSAGILPYRFKGNELEVMLVHPGGPFWTGRDEGAWSIPKGLFDQSEEPLHAAKREFREETGFEPEGEFIGLGELKQPSRKTVHAWGWEADLDTRKIRSNTFTLEWPKNSGRFKDFPEVDAARWFMLDEARAKILKGQLGFLDRLVDRVGKNTAQNG